MNETEAHIALQIIPGLGRITHKRLLKTFGTASDVWKSSSELVKLNWLAEKVRTSICAGADMRRVEAVLKKMDAISGWIMAWGDDDYPSRLADIYDPPYVLYGMGRRDVLSMDAISIVGSRKATAYGRQVARHLAAEMVRKDMAVVSGLAIGVDSEAHYATVAAGGVTVAVKGCGLDIPYPRSNLKLAASIAGKGAIITEFPPGTEPEPRNFPIRNRIISGLSLGVIVVEAAERSGSLITASMAADQGREVMAVPGNMFSSNSRGTHWLLKQGANIVTSAEDVLECVNRCCDSNHVRDLHEEGDISNCTRKFSDEERGVLRVLSGSPLHIDDIVSLSNMSIADVSELLLNLELDDVVRAMPGQMYCLEPPWVVDHFL